MKSDDRVQRGARLFCSIVCAVAVVSCGENAEKKVGQSVARVDDYELTVHQLKGELMSMDAAPAKDDASLKSKALDSLIDRRLLIAEAERNKIDRDPEVMQAIERQKGQVIIQALLQRKAASAPRPTPEEVLGYYRSNPVLFAHRKLYDMRQITFAAESYTPELKALIDSGKSLDDLAVWLDKNNVQFIKASTSPSTADLPSQLVTRLDVVGSGKPFVIKDPARVVVATLHLTKEIPVSEDEAKPQIEQYLLNTRIRDVTTAELARLRAAAKIEYLDEGIARAATASRNTNAQTTAKPDDHISKGVSGLK